MPKTYTPRYFWRRLAAYIIDVASLIILLTAIVAVIQPLVSIQLIVPTIVSSSACRQIEDLKLSKHVVALLKPTPEETIVSGLCQTSSPGSPTRNTLTIEAVKFDGNKRSFRYVSYYVDEQLRPIAHLDVGSISFLFMPLLFAFMLARTGTTLGKKLLGIRLENISEQPAGLVRYAKREYLRFLPGLLQPVVAIGTGMIFFHPDNLEKYASLVQKDSSLWIYPLVLSLVIFAIFITFLISFIRWRGGMVYDRLTGFEVHRSGEQPPQPDADQAQTS